MYSLVLLLVDCQLQPIQLIPIILHQKHKLDLTSLSLLIFTALNGYYVFEMTTFFLEYCKSACACRQSWVSQNKALSVHLRTKLKAWLLSTNLARIGIFKCLAVIRPNFKNSFTWNIWIRKEVWSEWTPKIYPKHLTLFFI